MLYYVVLDPPTEMGQELKDEGSADIKVSET